MYKLLALSRSGIRQNSSREWNSGEFHYKHLIFALLVLLISFTGCVDPATDPMVQIEVGKTAMQQGRYEVALRTFNDILDPTNAEHADGFYQRGLTHEQLGDADRALQDYQQAFRLNPQHLQALNNRAAIYGKTGKFDLAIKELTKVLEIDSSFALAYRNRGLARHDADQWPEAHADYDKAIELDDQDAEAYFLRGNLRLDMKKRKLAIDDYDKVIELAESPARAWMNRGIAYFELGDQAEARKCFEKSTSLDDELAVANLLTSLLDHIGSAEEAPELVDPTAEATKFLESKGWQVTPNDDPLLPLRIKSGSSESLVFLATADSDSSEPVIFLTAEQGKRIISLTEPLALLVRVATGAEDTEVWQLHENWKLVKNENYVVSQLRVSLP